MKLKTAMNAERRFKSMVAGWRAFPGGLESTT